ncbi:MAG TPA: hypothetical protein VG167_00885 [Verrucomicrobiae bacterium]|nr:hypothetical protein [Verrucomicrobiae bacterium]
MPTPITILVDGRATFEQLESALGGLQQKFGAFFSGIQGRMNAVSDLNKQLQNGSAALNDLAGKFTAVLGVAALQQFGKEAIASGRSMAQLGAVLKSTKQDSEAMRAQLEEQRKTLSGVTGVEQDELVSVQRLLLTYGASADVLPKLTALTLDYAAATGMGATEAATLLGRALSGQDVVLRGMRLTIDQTLPRGQQLALLMEMLAQRVGGQARAAFEQTAPDVERFNIQLKETEKAIGAVFIKDVAGPFLKGLGEGLGKLEISLQNFNRDFPETANLMRSFASTLGDVLGRLAPVILAFGAMVIAVQGVRLAFSAVMPALNLARLGLTAIAGVDVVGLLGMVRSFRDLSYVLTEVGVAAGRAAGAIGALATAAAIAYSAKRLGDALLDEQKSATNLMGQNAGLEATILSVAKAQQEAGLMTQEAADGYKAQVMQAKAAAASAAEYEDRLKKIAVALRGVVVATKEQQQASLQKQVFDQQMGLLGQKSKADFLAAAAPALLSSFALDQALNESAYRRGEIALEQYLAERQKLIAQAAQTEQAPIQSEVDYTTALIMRKQQELANAREDDYTEQLRLQGELAKLRTEKDKLTTALRVAEENTKKATRETSDMRPQGFTGTLQRQIYGPGGLQETFGNFGGNAASAALSNIKSGIDGVSNAVADAIYGVKSWGQAWMSIGKNIVSSIMQITMQYVASKLAMMAVDAIYHKQSQGQAAQTAATSGVAGVAKAGEQGGWVGVLIYLGVFAAAVAAISAIAAGVSGGFAAGGRPPVGQPALVGELGPELFLPDRPGTIVPADKTAALLRSGGGAPVVGQSSSGPTRFDIAIEQTNSQRARDLERDPSFEGIVVNLQQKNRWRYRR